MANGGRKLIERSLRECEAIYHGLLGATLLFGLAFIIPPVN